MAHSLPPIDYIPTVAEVDRVASVADPVIRNLQITQCYHELALAMTPYTGIHANWCTFATWASKQAGQTIRREDLARAVESFFGEVVMAQQAVPDLVASAQAFGSKQSEGEIQESVADLLNPLAALDRAGDAVARGNRKVFTEIGREFARFYAHCLYDTTFDTARLTDFCEGLHPGDPPDGQQYLRQAFTRYYQAAFEPDTKRRAELMLLGNLEIALHEQTRLQPEIAEALDAALLDRREFRSRLLKALFPYRGILARLRLFLLRLLDRPSPFDAALDFLWAQASRQLHLVITEYLLMITFPGGLRIRLGDDLMARFPIALQQIVLPDLCALLDKIDPTRDSTAGTGAVDWAQLGDRMHFIADLFRCYHESPNLFQPPFTPEQVTALKAGQVPAGPL